MAILNLAHLNYYDWLIKFKLINVFFFFVNYGHIVPDPQTLKQIIFADPYAFTEEENGVRLSESSSSDSDSSSDSSSSSSSSSDSSDSESG